MTSPLLLLQGVHSHIGAYHILHGVDLEVPRGGVTLLLGRNGAGKTTTLRTIMGLVRTTQGSTEFEGKRIDRLSTSDIARRGIAHVPESMDIFTDLTVAENMLVAARSASRLPQLDRRRLDWIFSFFPALAKFWNYKAGLLSGGQKQMLAIARAIYEPSKLLLIDEPSKGLAPAIILNMLHALQELKRSDTTILLVEQNFAFAKQLGDTVNVVDDGRTVHRGSLASLTQDEALQVQLLGLHLRGTNSRDERH